MGEGVPSTFNFASACAPFKSHLTATLYIPSSSLKTLHLSIASVTRCGRLVLSMIALSSITCISYLPATGKEPSLSDSSFKSICNLATLTSE